MADTRIGRIRPRARGLHSTEATYEVMDLVRNADSTATYMAIKDVPSGVELTDASYWVLFLNALEGKQGEQGEPGVSVEKAEVNEDGHLVVTLTDENTIDAGCVIGPEGPQGKAFTYEDFTEEQLEALRGPEGPQGQGITILGSYETEDALIAEHPTGKAGDAYLVEGSLYVWSATNAAWENVGSIQGPAGKDGVDGSDGPAGYTPVRGTDYWTDADKAEIKGYVDEAILGGAW